MGFRRSGNIPFRLLKKPKLRALVCLLFLTSSFTIYHSLDESFSQHLSRLSHAKPWLWPFLASSRRTVDESSDTSQPATRKSKTIPSSVRVPRRRKSGVREPKFYDRSTPVSTTPFSPEVTSSASTPTSKRRRTHRCWTEPCKFLFPGVIGEQLTKASLHFYQLALLARELNRTIVVPHVADSRIESCLKYPFGTYFDTRGLKEIDWIEISEFVDLIREKFRAFNAAKRSRPSKDDKTTITKIAAESSSVSEDRGQLAKAKSAYAHNPEIWAASQDIYNEEDGDEFDIENIEEPTTQSRISTTLFAQPNRVPASVDIKPSTDYNWFAPRPFASLVPGSSSYNATHSITNPAWISAQYIVFSEKSLPDNIDRNYPRGLRELLKCYRTPVNNSDGFPANTLPFNRPLLNFVPPENQMMPDDSAEFTPAKTSPDYLEDLRRRVEEDDLQENEKDEEDVQNSLHRLAVFATLRSLASVEVLGLHYTWRKPRLFPKVVLSPLDYNPALWARARQITSKYLPRPFIAVHWRMETVDPRGMPACADMLADHIQKLKRSRLENSQEEGTIEVNERGEEHDGSEFSVYLANDLPPIQGKLLRRRATTFMNASDLYYVGRNRLFDAVPGISTWEVLSSLDTAVSGDSAPLVPGEAQSDTGILGIFDKLVCALADHFVAGPVGCSKGSSFTEQIVVLRSDNNRLMSEEGVADGPVDPKAPKEKRIYNIIDSWPEPTIKLVKEVGKEFGVVLEEEWEDWMDWSGERKGSRTVEGGRYVYGGV